MRNAPERFIGQAERLPRAPLVLHGLAALPLLLLFTPSAPAAPRLAVPPEGVAFGEIPAGEPATKSVEIRNVSPSPVLIAQVKGCCGADASLSSMFIAPSEAATLTVSLKLDCGSPLCPRSQVQWLCTVW